MFRLKEIETEKNWEKMVTSYNQEIKIVRIHSSTQNSWKLNSLDISLIVYGFSIFL